MSVRPVWLEQYRVHNLNRHKRGKKAVYVDSEGNIVKATHFNLNGGSYCIPREKENDFLRKYVDSVFGNLRTKLAFTESAIVSAQGLSYSSVFIDLDLSYEASSEGK